jgi:DNA-binding transcriptional MerR regulator
MVYFSTVSGLMADSSAAVDIPKRALFKASEVCDIVRVQPYVLRTWEAEFPELGVTKTPGAPRVYRRADVEQVARIKHLLLVEGLTLAGARRRLEDDAAPIAPAAPLEELIGQNARERLTTVKRGLRSLLDLLSRTSNGLNGGHEFQLAAPPVRPARVSSIGLARAKAKGKPAARGKAKARRRA